MKESRAIMGMPITIEIVDNSATSGDLEHLFAYLVSVDERFSTYKPESEISQINSGKLVAEEWSDDMRTIFLLAEETKQKTFGYFDIATPEGTIDPSGIVKGWAISQVAELLHTRGITNFYIDAGGDIEAHGVNMAGIPWSVGIRNPFNATEIVSILALSDAGVATSGTSMRGAHIYDPHRKTRDIHDIVSMTVIGPNAFEADRFATAAFAMGRKGIAFIETHPGLEGYMIDKEGIGTATSGFDTYLKSA